MTLIDEANKWAEKAEVSIQLYNDVSAALSYKEKEVLCLREMLYCSEEDDSSYLEDEDGECFENEHDEIKTIFYDYKTEDIISGELKRNEFDIKNSSLFFLRNDYDKKDMVVFSFSSIKEIDLLLEHVQNIKKTFTE